MRRTILLADDSLTIQRLVAGTFADGDFEVVSVSNGEAAIRKFEEIHPNVVLADIYMPGRNGYEVCTYVRQHGSLGSTPVILLVGAFDAFDEDQAQQIGATANITKPFEPRALVALVESVLSSPAVEAAAATAEPAVLPVTPDAAVAASNNSGAGAESSGAVVEDRTEDLLGLASLFKEPEPEVQPAPALSEQEVDRIADRVIQRISSQVIENIAWEVLPDVAERIVREELKKNQ